MDGTVVRAHRFHAGSRHRMAGLTLIELIVSLVLVGVLSSITAVFLRVPMQSYFVSRQRTDLTESIELSMRHMEQELRQALPNSVRIKTVGAVTYIEFLATRTSGRYRSVAGGPAGACAGGNELQSAPASDTCFTTLGTLANATQIKTGAAGDYLVIRNLGPGTAADAYLNGAANLPNKSRISAVTASLGAAPAESRLNFASIKFVDSVDHTFYVVSGPVTYACDGAKGRLLRYGGYAIAAVQPTPPTPPPGPSVVASNLLQCTASYDAANASLAEGLVSIVVNLQNALPGNTDLQQANFLVQVPVSKAQ